MPDPHTGTWNQVACGQTDQQRQLTEQARRFMNRDKPSSSRSLKL